METDVIRWAREVDPVTALLLDRKAPQGMDHETFVWFLKRFAALVASAEREKCAKFLELIDLSCMAEHESCQRLMAGLLKNCAESIRTRGQK